MGLYRNLNQIQRRTTCNEHYLTIAAKIIKIKFEQGRATCTAPLIYDTGNIRSKHGFKNAFFVLQVRGFVRILCSNSMQKF